VQADIGNELVGGLNDIDPTVLDGQLDTDPIQSGIEPTSIGSSELIRQLTLDKSTLIEHQKSDPTLAKGRDRAKVNNDHAAGGYLGIFGNGQNQIQNISILLLAGVVW
jgi:hypothetical protein